MDGETVDVQAVGRALALRDKILSARPKLVPVECPKLGLTAFVNGSMTVAERLKVAAWSKGQDDISVDLCILAARDESGVPLFTEADRDALAEADGESLQAIALAALRANGMARGAAEEARGN